MKKGLLITGLGVLAFSAMSFFISDEEGQKNKKYHIIHQKDGELVEFDTIVPMNSNYTVENFLSDNGISNENVEIITMPSIEENHFIHNGDHKIMKIDCNVDKSFMMDGEEMDFEIKDGEEKVEIKIEQDENGEQSIRKWVNGEEVELTEAEMEEIHSGHNGAVFMVKMDSVDFDMDEVMKEVHMELEGINFDSIMQTVMVDMHEMVDLKESADGAQKMIIKIETDLEGLEEDLEKMGEEIEFHQEHIVKVNSTDEDFTIVLVTENYDASSPETTKQVIEPKNGSNFSVYPNPSNGNFTIEFDQEEKVATTVEVVDLSGKTIFKDKLGKFNGKYRKELNLLQEGAGTYVIRIQRGDEMEVQKVVIQ